MKKLPKTKPLFDPYEFLTEFRTKLQLDLDPLRGLSTYHSFGIERFVQECSKKYLLPSDAKARADKAYAKFLVVNAEMEAFKNFRIPEHRCPASRALIMMKHIIWHVLYKAPCYEQVFDKTKSSPGSSIGVPFSDTSIERKFRYPISITSDCVALWQVYKQYDPQFADAICRLNESLIRDNIPELNVVAGSRTSTVPKSSDIDRMIGVEPVGNMFFQHGASHQLEDALKAVGLSFTRDPEKHRRMACYASITEGNATVDFSSMSDRVAIGIARAYLPESWFRLLMTIRCSRTEINGEWHELHMISTMGNATTFPIETLLLWALSMACVQVTRQQGTSTLPDLQKRDWKGSVSTFGDDCILPCDAVPLFFECAVKLGFKVNEEKSFYRDNEYFRESCGGDFYHGRDVRPFYLGALPQTRSKIALEAYLYSTINGVIRKYIQYFGTLTYLYDKSLLAWLFSCLNLVTDYVKFVPEDYPDDSGITSLRDIQRFLRAMPHIKPSRVQLNKHGQLNFTYLRYVFPEKTEWNEALRWAVFVKALPAESDLRLEVSEALLHKYNIRRKGTYVQAVSKFEQTIRLPSTQNILIITETVSRSELHQWIAEYKKFGMPIGPEKQLFDATMQKSA